MTSTFWIIWHTYYVPFNNIYRDPQFEEMLDLFAMLKKGYCDGIKVRIGRLQNLLSSSCMGMSHNIVE